MCRLVAVQFPASGTAVYDDVALFGIGLGTDRLKLPAAGVSSVAGIDVYVKRPKTMRAVIARSIAKRLDLSSAVNTDK